MLRQILSISIVLFLCACSPSEKRKSFEGIITYNISFAPKTGNEAYSAYQKQKFGDSLKLYISRSGSFKREYPSGGDRGYDFNIYGQAINKIYYKWRNIDTVYGYDVSKNSLKFNKDADLAAEVINGIKCNTYQISGIEPLNGQPVTLTYYYPTDKEYIDPKLYSNFKDFFYNKIISKIKAPYYKLVMDMGSYVMTFTMTNIESKDLPEAIFSMPAGVPLKTN
jgi:hypothetical protein